MGSYRFLCVSMDCNGFLCVVMGPNRSLCVFKCVYGS